MDKEKLVKLYPIDWSQAKIEGFRKDLLAWYDKNRRDLPWRQTTDPYKIWISEIMLQQTQVETVIPFYQNFITKYPTVTALAEAKEDDLMQLWQGLGYYSRVRNLLSAAQQVVNEFNGEMPHTVSDLLSLKGIGPYTAGAIASIAFNQAEPALDGNLMRIISRVFEIDDDITKTQTKRKMMAILYQLIDPNRPGDFNQALMDLGATVMTPHNYYPEDSPIKKYDQSFIKGTSDRYPVKASKSQSTQHNYLAYYIVDQTGKYLMRKHQSGELLQGLWHFPLVESQIVLEEAKEFDLLLPLIDYLPVSDLDLKVKTSQSGYFVKSKVEQSLPPIQHVFSHRIWRVQLVPVEASREVDKALPDNWRWLTAADLMVYPTSTLQKKLMSQLGFEFGIEEQV